MRFISCIHFCYRPRIRITGTVYLLLILFPAWSQQKEVPRSAVNLEECISYALLNQPSLRQTIIDEAITERTIRSKLADRYPEVGLNYSIQHYLQRPLVTAPLSLKNSSATTVSLSQNIFNSNVLLAAKTAGDIRLIAKQNTQLSKIDLVVGVSKAFYDVLVSRQQIDILEQDVVRLQKSLRDAQFQYEGGTADKTDYKRAAIALNRALASKKQLEEILKGKMASLKQQMGYRDSAELKLVYDNEKLEGEVMTAPADPPSYQARVEYQQLRTQQRLLDYNLKYTKWSYLPVISFVAAYNLVAQNNTLSKIYRDGYPNSYVGLTLSVPVFQGTKRLQATRLAELELSRLNWDFKNLELQINAEYINARAVYNASLNDYLVSKENLSLAKEVYATVQLQYRSGVKTYLDVVIAETDLRTAEVNMLDALYLVLSSKLDVQRAAGTINY